MNEARAHARQKRLQERVDARSRKKWTGSESYKDSVDDDAIGRFAKCALEEKPLLIISYGLIEPTLIGFRRFETWGCLFWTKRID